VGPYFALYKLFTIETLFQQLAAEVHLCKLQLFLVDNRGGTNQLILQDLRPTLMAKVLLGITFIAETSIRSFLLFSFMFKLGL
jgi:hypothetical protein